MTNKEAIWCLEQEGCCIDCTCSGYPNCEVKECNTYKALDLAIKALEIVDDVNRKVYRNENCDRKRTCYDYIGYHCAGCNGAKESENE